MKRKILFFVSLLFVLVVFFSSCSTFQEVDRKVVDRQVDMRKTEWIFYK